MPQARHTIHVYLWLIPAVFFACIGTYDIVSDAWVHRLTFTHVLLNTTFFVPLCIRHRTAYLVSGIILELLSLYICWGIFRSLGAPATSFPVGIISVITGFMMLCSTSLLYLGIKNAEAGNK